MNKPKTDKLLKGLVGSSVALFGLTGCSPGLQEELLSVPAEPDPEVNVQPDAGPPSPDEADCDTWQWDEEAEGYQCVEPGNENHGHYYYGGMWFPTIAAFMAGRATAGGARGGTQAGRPATGNQPDQNVNQPRQDQNQTRSPNRATNPRSGMGGGGSFGG
ncbi:hypothetical protein JCM9140_4426 [Halalkalibacter wakoensis JCM 9140]|uniref:Lipoprotein n=1 Tax=Halalkalibacter wakoensis JCM 9140 TaxID=1236970 RepID=W4Q817_9BACI|nr:hypothetical protein [Halalkalibacter wakoensis]GAE28216.1 hypothetical protein JCM9140_4426 [Halalkalibacter wakoensis JCM 9140]